MKFSFQWIPFCVVVIAVAVGIALGNWQLRRADEKRAIESTLIARQRLPPLFLDGAVQNIEDIEYRRVVVRGEFDHDWVLYLDNRPNEGNAGFYMLMPFRIVGSNLHVLVARGWVPLDAYNRTKLPAPMTPQGTVEIEGMAVSNVGHVMQLGVASPVRPGAILQNLTVPEFAAASKFDMQPFMIEQSNDTHDKMLRHWPHRSVGIERHFGYAFQWYALAATAFLFFLLTGYRRGAKK